MAKRKKKKSSPLLHNITTQCYGQVIQSEMNHRLTEMTKLVAETESRHTGALMEVNRSRELIEQTIQCNRGGATGMHGFIGEKMQVYLSNAWDIMKGKEPVHNLIDDNGMTDYFRYDIPIQQKACISDNCLGLSHILDHSMKYPDFDGIYQIPKDQYNLLIWYQNLSPDFAVKLSKAEYRQYKKVMKYLPLLKGKKIEPMVVSYDEIQAGKAFQTLNRHKEGLDRFYRSEKSTIIQSHRPSIGQCAKSAGISAGLQGGIGLISTTYHHAKEKNGLDKLERQDWLEIGKNTAIETGKGAVHGAGVYAMTNYIPGMTANSSAAIMTFIIDGGSETVRYCKHEISRKEYCYTLLDIGADAGFAAIFAKIGGKLIPIPFAGEIIGSLVGRGAYSLIKGLGNKCIPMIDRRTKADQLLAALPSAG